MLMKDEQQRPDWTAERRFRTLVLSGFLSSFPPPPSPSSEIRVEVSNGERREERGFLEPLNFITRVPHTKAGDGGNDDGMRGEKRGVWNAVG